MERPVLPDSLSREAIPFSMSGMVGGLLSESSIRRIVKMSGVLIAAHFVSACSLEANITSSATEAQPPFVTLTRTDPDFLSGEVVTTSGGTTIRAVFGEVAEKRVLSSGHEIEGVVQ